MLVVDTKELPVKVPGTGIGIPPVTNGLQRGHMRMTMYHELWTVRGVQFDTRNGKETAAFIAVASMSAGIRRRQRDAGGQIRVEHAERTDCQRVTQHGSETPVRSILACSKTVTMLQQRKPTTDMVAPRPQRVGDSRFLHERAAAPAIMVAANPDDLDPGFTNVRERCEHAKPTPWHGAIPGKPKVK